MNDKKISNLALYVGVGAGVGVAISNIAVGVAILTKQKICHE